MNIKQIKTKRKIIDKLTSLFKSNVLTQDYNVYNQDSKVLISTKTILLNGHINNLINKIINKHNYYISYDVYKNIEIVILFE